MTLSTDTRQLLMFWASGRFDVTEGAVLPLDTQYQPSLLAKARPDECFNGIGKAYGTPDANGLCATGQPKTNDAYVWGLTLQNDKLFFGTMSNTLCGVEAGYLEVTSPLLYDEYVCEFGSSVKRTDTRPPNLFMYDLATDQLASLNPTGVNTAAENLRLATGGFRSAGSLNGVAFVAGTGRAGGINVFAFDADTGALIGNGFTMGASPCIRTPYSGQPLCPGNSVYTNVRQWAVAGNALYLGVGTRADLDPSPATTVYQEGGAVLRWTGTKTDPYHFEEVGHLPADAANMIAHTDGRLYITTWPRRAKGAPLNSPEAAGDMPAGLYRSPIIPYPDGLTSLNVNDPDWSTPLWLATSDLRPEHANVPTYDPDRLAGLHIGGGALASYHGRIYFGTMTVPMYGVQDAAETFTMPQGDFLRTMFGAARPIALFEVNFANGTPNVSMVVGDTYLPIYDAAKGGYTIAYDAAHRTGFIPYRGPSGFGNFWNTYTWALRVFQDQVWVGTMDWSQLARINMDASATNSTIPPATMLQLLNPTPGAEGADLIRFSEYWMVSESVNGVGNDRNYGVRNMVTDGNSLFIGTANPMNLDPLGGWELIELK